MGRRCTQTTAVGQPCRSWAMAGSSRCVSHLRIAHRKTTLTPEVTEQLAAMLRHGVPFRTAAAAVNVSKTTLHRWLLRDEPEYVAFREQVEQARGQGEAALVLQVIRESERDWSAAAWLLEREHPETFGRPADRVTASDEVLDDPLADFASDADALARMFSEG